jgi:hypothetical protein
MIRYIKASDASQAGLEVGENAIRLSGGREAFFYSDASGCYIVGSISLLAEPNNIRVGSKYLFPTAYQGVIPSTLASPQPIFIENSPVQGFADLAEEVESLLSDLL